MQDFINIKGARVHNLKKYRRKYSKRQTRSFDGFERLG